tara:strand:- start:375 stop:545 length:171 start_codon:yes stop_codon:yes gene_type:complete
MRFDFLRLFDIFQMHLEPIMSAIVTDGAALINADNTRPGYHGELNPEMEPTASLSV